MGNSEREGADETSAGLESARRIEMIGKWMRIYTKFVAD